MDSRDKFAQMLREGYEALDPEKEQREYIRELLRRKERQRKRRVRTITAVAAAFFIVVGTVLAVGGCFGAAEADKNDRTKVEEHNGSAVIKGENTEDEEIGPEVAKVTDWDGIAELKEQYPEMITFTDVPEGMEFVSVEVKEEFDIAEITYCFGNNGNEIRIFQIYCLKGTQQTQIIENEESEYISYKGYQVNIDDEGRIDKATIIMDNGNVDIIGNMKKKNVFNVIDKIKAP